MEYRKERNIEMSRRLNWIRFLISIGLLCCFPLMLSEASDAENTGSYVSFTKVNNAMQLAENGKVAPFVVNSNDWSGVKRVLSNVQTDVKNVTGTEPEIVSDIIPNEKEIVLVGTIGKSSLIDKLVEIGKLDVSDIRGKWEVSLIQVVDNPLENVDRALVIAGSDKRGTIYGLYDLSEKIGVSAWHFWSDVPAKKHKNIYILPGRYSYGEPKVKYRGIFINDEAPALAGWSNATYGTQQFNHELYEHVFDLILRMKGNFLWPAMWGRAFYDDDPVNPELAEEYGIVISTSHHEPMMRAHVEWERYGEGPWNYEKNEEELQEFWREGIERMGDNESIVTLAMRGDGDEAMSPNANVSLLEKIVKDQRNILEEVTGKPLAEVPQVWALYKEVQEYYDKGMRVPDDVTLLFCDDNWGNVRKLPGLDPTERIGGYGMYYHFDFVGGPRSYRWLNTNPIGRIWEQMNLCFNHGVDRIWIVNVGDIKPMEFPIEFFLDFAWNPEKWKADKLPEYTRLWVKEQFGDLYTDEIADILTRYLVFNSRRKPELLSPETFSLTDYREAERVVNDYNALLERAQKIYDEIPVEFQNAFYEIILHPVQACANLNELYVTVGKNHLYAEQGRAATNELAAKAKDLFERDAEITYYYNNVLADGKWSHMMDQTHIGYTSWNNPPENIMPTVRKYNPPDKPEMGVAIEGSSNWWPNADSDAKLPEYDNFNKQTYYIEVFNRGSIPFDYKIISDTDWIVVSDMQGTIDDQKRLLVGVNWEKAPKGRNSSGFTISAPNSEPVNITVEVNNLLPSPGELACYIESNGYVSIEAEHYREAVEPSPVSWQIVPNMGRTLSAVIPEPVTAASQEPGGNSPRLEYDIYFFSTGEFTVNTYLSPTLNFNSSNGLRFAVSIDDEDPQIVNMHANDRGQDWKYPGWWNEAVTNNIRIYQTKHTVTNPGKHTLKYWMIDPAVPLQKLVVDTGLLKPSYLGPPESYNRTIINGMK